MRKSIVGQFKQGTPEHIIAHAAYRVSRGRRPSMSFHGINNPREALNAAKAAVISRLVLKFDPLDFAEKRLGGIDDSSSLGFGLHILRSNALRNLMNVSDDTHHGMGTDEYLRVVHDEGFETVLRIPFRGKTWNENDVAPEETAYVLFQPKDGILLRFDTVDGKRVNSSSFYYNWSANSEDDTDCRSSGHWVDYPKLWSGNHDGREALRLHIGDLRAKGTFVTPWIEQPFLWLLHYMDTEDPSYDYKAINAERIAMLPKEVQRAIGQPA